MASRSSLHRNGICNDGCRFPPHGSHVVASSQFRLRVTCHPLNRMADNNRGRLLKATRFRNLRHIILGASASNLKEDPLSGTELKDKSLRLLNADTILVVSEGICISVASVCCLASLTMHGSQDSRLVISSSSEPIMPQKADLPTWQTLFLLAALAINSIIRARQWQSRGHSGISSSKLVVADLNTERRVQKLEEDVANAVTIIRVLSKQLEKLAVRFRVTRQTLRDPIHETAILAQKTSESVNVLLAREDATEKNLEEMHHILVRMQENQTKQLELISTLGKLVKEGPRSEVIGGNKAAKKNPPGAISQWVGQGRQANEGDGILQSNVAKNIGGFTCSEGLSVQRTNTETTEHRMWAKDTSNEHFSPSTPSNSFARDTPRVDFWLNSTQAEDPVGGARITKHL